jgi:AraC-like DNA-binding protein
VICGVQQKMMMTKIFQQPSLFEVRYVDEVGGCERPHTHSSLIVSAVSGGYISLQINEVEIRLKRGVVAVVGPDILHCARVYSTDFKGVYVLDVFGLPTSCSKFNSVHFHLFKSQLLHGSQSYNDFTNLCMELLSPLESAQKTELLSDWLNTLFIAHYSSVTKELSKHGDLAEKIRYIIDSHEGEKPPFDEISKTCGLSKQRCNRIFRNAYNISMQGYFLNEKAAHARTLLNSGQSLSDIALECGFYDQSHFSRIFKEIFQISPAKYRALIGGARQSRTRKD